MTDRKYSVEEVNALRRVVESKYLFGSYHGRCGFSRAYKDVEKDKTVEEMVRTHMIAGHTAEDLLASEKPSEESPTG